MNITMDQQLTAVALIRALATSDDDGYRAITSTIELEDMPGVTVMLASIAVAGLAANAHTHDRPVSDFLDRFVAEILDGAIQ